MVAGLGSQLGLSWAPLSPAQVVAISRQFCSSCWEVPGRTQAVADLGLHLPGGHRASTGSGHFQTTSKHRHPTTSTSCTLKKMLSLLQLQVNTQYSALRSQLYSSGKLKIDPRVSILIVCSGILCKNVYAVFYYSKTVLKIFMQKSLLRHLDFERLLLLCPVNCNPLSLKVCNSDWFVLLKNLLSFL